MPLNQNKLQNFLSSGPGIGLTSLVGIFAILGLVAFILHFVNKKECGEGYTDPIKFMNPESNIELSPKLTEKDKKELEKDKINKDIINTIVYIPYLKKKINVPISSETSRSGIIKAHRHGGMWEENLANIISQYSKKNSVCVDIGAFIGTHSYVMSNCVGDNGTVYTFEPQDWACKSINSTIEMNDIKNIKLFNIGLSNKNGKINFCSSRTGGSYILGERKYKDKCDPGYNYNYDIEIKKLDDFNLSNVSCIKIDAEGHELEILEGSINTIKTNRPVIFIEVWSFNKKMDKIRKLFAENNYNIKNISGDDYLCTPK